MIIRPCWPGDSFPALVSVLSVYINKAVWQAAAGGFRLPRAAHGKVAGLWTQPCPKKRSLKLPLTFERGCTASLAQAGALDSLSGSLSQSSVRARAATEDTVTFLGWLGIFSAGSHFSRARCFQGCGKPQPRFRLCPSPACRKDLCKQKLTMWESQCKQKCLKPPLVNDKNLLNV